MELVHRPSAVLTKKQPQEAMKLDIYNQHFSFIKNIKVFSKTFSCQRCGGNFILPWHLIRHERSCEAKDQVHLSRRSLPSYQDHL